MIRDPTPRYVYGELKNMTMKDLRKIAREQAKEVNKMLVQINTGHTGVFHQWNVIDKLHNMLDRTGMIKKVNKINYDNYNTMNEVATVAARVSYGNKETVIDKILALNRVLDANNGLYIDSGKEYQDFDRKRQTFNKKNGTNFTYDQYEQYVKFIVIYKEILKDLDFYTEEILSQMRDSNNMITPDVLRIFQDLMNGTSLMTADEVKAHLKKEFNLTYDEEVITDNTKRTYIPRGGTFR